MCRHEVACAIKDRLAHPFNRRPQREKCELRHASIHLAELRLFVQCVAQVSDVGAIISVACQQTAPDGRRRMHVRMQIVFASVWLSECERSRRPHDDGALIMQPALTSVTFLFPAAAHHEHV